MPVHPNLKFLSHSSILIEHACPRKFYLYRMIKPTEIEEDSVDLQFGKVVGVGTQTYLTSNSPEAALFAMFLEWKDELWSEDGKKKKKTFFHAMIALDEFTTWRQTELADYELLYIDDKPAIELGFSLTCIDGFTYRGYLDALLINKKTKTLLVYEGKTTGAWNVNEAMYKNSGQALGYSLIIDKIAQLLGSNYSSDYEVLYSVYKCNDKSWEPYIFHKSHTQRALWIRNLLRDIQHIIEYAEEGHFPMHGESCFAYGKPCDFFDICEMKDSTLISKRALATQVGEEDEKKYQFKFDLMDIINNQLERL